MRWFASLQSLGPDFSCARMIYGDKKDYDRKLADLNQAISVSPNVAIYLHRARNRP